MVLAWITRPWKTLHKVVLLLLSYAFYGAWDLRLVPLILTTSLGAYLFARLVDIPAITTTHALARKKLLIFGIVLFIGTLVLFKYQVFLISQLNTLFSWAGVPVLLPAFDVILPVGISFYLFQMISYITDVYRGHYAARKNPLDVLLYVAFFPQLVAGPIVRGHEFFPQLALTRKLKDIEISRALVLIGTGLLKKVVVAHYLATLVVDPAFENPAQLVMGSAWFALYSYGIQIYCDFSAYSEIAVGVALLLGYNFPMNFNKPLGASTLQDFWRRWHITLSTWLKDYLYIPLGGSKNGGGQTARNILITMVLGGLWHGANVNFLFWGLLHGLGQIFEHFLRSVYSKGKFLLKFLKPLYTVLVFHFVVFTWLFFRSPDWATTGVFLSKLTTPGSFFIHPLVLFLGLPILISQWLPDGSRKKVADFFYGLKPKFALLLLMLIFLLLRIIRPAGVAPFIYFQF